VATIISFNAFLRGTGRSHLMANLATLLAADGKRVGIADLDDSAPAQQLIFGLPEAAITFTLADSMAGRCRVEQAAYEVTPQDLRSAGGGIFLAPLNIEPGWAPRASRKGMNLDRLGDTLRDLRQTLALDYLLTDSGSGINELSLTALAASDTAVFVLRLDKHDYQGTAVTIDLARKLEVPRLLLIVNMAAASFDRAEVRAKVAETYDCEVVGVLPYTDQMMVREGPSLFVLDCPAHQLTVELRKIADQI
jgi:MinD-like ATPase involved in chromosome partitioning or flagellar assembly